jgi:hypothetical protein
LVASLIKRWGIVEVTQDADGPSCDPIPLTLNEDGILRLIRRDVTAMNGAQAG